jgi:hypothetical protein
MDLGFLRSLYDNPECRAGAGYVSVYLETTPAIEKSPTKVALRWRSAREHLAADGADTPTLAAVQDHLTGRTHAAAGLAVFGCGGSVRLSSTLTVPPPLEVSRYARLPHIMPLLAQSPRHVAHVRVGANREGGQVLAFSAAGTSEQATIHGESWPVNKVSVGGWSELRLQRSTEDTWGDNAKRLADTAVVAAERVQAEFVVVGGDTKERRIVLDLLPEQVRESAVVVDREASPDAPAFAAAAQAEAARRGASESRAKLDEFRSRISGEASSRHATEGFGATLAALRDGLASAVLIDDEIFPDTMAWIGPGMADLATEKEQLLDRGIADPGNDRADAAVARAIAGTHASLFFIPRDDANPPRDGIGALLRAPLSAL